MIIMVDDDDWIVKDNEEVVDKILKEEKFEKGDVVIYNNERLY